MIYTIVGFDHEDFQAFSEKINLLKDGEKLTIFIDSYGGSVVIMDMYLHVINSLPNVEVVGSVLYSAAFTLFERLNCKKSLLPSSYGMVHHEAWETQIGYEGTPRGQFAKFQMDFKMKSKPPEMKWMKKRERKIFDKGMEVYLDRDRLKEIFSL